MKRSVAIGLGVAIVVAIVVVVGIFLKDNSTSTVSDSPKANPTSAAGDTSSDQDSTPLPTASAPKPASTAKPGHVKGTGKRIGKDLVEPFIAAEAAARTDQTHTIQFGDIATGDALKDLEVNAQEMREDGLVQVGSPKLVGATVLKVNNKAKPPTATVRVCQDYSDVDVQAPDGTSMKDKSAPQRVASTLVLKNVEGRWLVSKRTFPNKPTC